MDRAMFDVYVGFAARLIQIEREEFGDTLPEATLSVYLHQTVAERKIYLRRLIVESVIRKAAWDSLVVIARYYRRRGRPLPHELTDWLVAAVDGALKRPKTRGRTSHTNDLRNRAIVMAVMLLTSHGMKATRNWSGPKKCDYEGGSACDAVGIAVNKSYKNKKPLKYKAIEGIWTEKGTPESFFNRWDYRFFYQEAPGIDTPPEQIWHL